MSHAPRPSSAVRAHLPAAAFLALAGCAGPAYEPPVIERPAGPLSLDAAVALAIRNNPDVAAAGHRVEEAVAAIDQAASDYWPVLRVMERFTQTDTPSQAFGNILDQRRFDDTIDFNDPGITPNWHTGITGSITLYDGGRRRWRVARRAAEASAVAAAAEAVRRDLALEVARAFFLIHKAREAAAAQERSIQTLETHLRITEARHSEGAARRSDVLSVRVRLAETREVVIVARNSEARAEAGLLVLLGLPIDEPIVLEAPAPSDPPPPATLAELLDRALGGRVELGKAVLEVNAAKARANEALAGYFPEITLFGSFGFDDRDPFAFKYANWTWGFGIAQSILEIFRTPMRVRQAVAALAVASAAARKTLLGVELDVKDALLDAGEADARREVARQAAELAEETLRLVEAEYREGAATITRLLEAELALTHARTRLSAATYDRSLSRIAIEHAVGGYPPAPPAPTPEGAATDAET